MKKAIFLDRDGVLNEIVLRGPEGKPFSPRTLEELHVIEGVAPVLKQFAAEGYSLIVVTNQPDIARKDLTEEKLREINEALLKRLGAEKMIQDIFICPHSGEDHCSCRKPKPGMLLAAAKKWNIDLKESFFIGDREADMQAGAAAGCKTILMDRPYNQNVPADYRAKNMKDAAQWIQHSGAKK